MSTRVLAVVGETRQVEHPQAVVRPDGYAPSKWTPLTYWLVGGLGVTAIATIIAAQIDNQALFTGAYLITIALGIALVAVLGADNKAGPRGWSVAEDVEEN